MFSESQVKVILILLDERGHAGWELAEHIEMKESNLNPVLKKLEDKGIIYKNEVRDSTKPIREPGTKDNHSNYVRSKSRIGEYKEIPYFLNESIETLRTIIRELKGKKYPHVDAGFVLNIISRSKYIEALITKFGEDVNKCATDEINNDFSFTNKDFYMNWIADLFPRDLLDFKNRQPMIDTSLMSVTEEMEIEPGTKYMKLVCRRSNIEIWYNNYRMRMSPEADRY